MSDEFYTGYIPKGPPGIARWIRFSAVGMLAGAGAIATLLVFAQGRFPNATFEYGKTRVYEGVLDPLPYPALVLDDGSSLWLVGEGKHGAPHLSAGRLRIKGSLIERDGVRMLQVSHAEVSGDGSPHVTEKDLGPITVTGEIVDSKCHLGVMNPGQGKVHKDCAERCLRGGIPPALLVKDSNGVFHALMVEGRGEWRAAAPVTLSGHLVLRSGRYLLRLE
jgi:hypothetical protein